MADAVSEPLPDVGSFSYSWPTSRPKPPPPERIDGCGGGDGAGFSEIGGMDATTRCNFDFGFPRAAELAAAMANADQMFRDRLLLPLQLVTQQGDGDDDRTTMSVKGPVLLRSLSLDSSSQRMVVSASERHWLASPSPDSTHSGHRGGGAARAPYGMPKGAVFRASKLKLPSFGWCLYGEPEPRLPLPKRLSCKRLRLLVPFCNKMVTCIWRRKARDAPQRAGAAADFCNGKVCDLGRESAVRDAILHCKKSL